MLWSVHPLHNAWHVCLLVFRKAKLLLSGMLRLLSTCMPSKVLGTGYAFSHSIFPRTHFTDDKTKAERLLRTSFTATLPGRGENYNLGLSPELMYIIPTELCPLNEEHVSLGLKE